MPGDAERRGERKAAARAVIVAPRGTIRPDRGFDDEQALAEAKLLNRALTKPVDTVAVIGLLTKRTAEDRKHIEDVYNQQYPTPLHDTVRRQFSCNLQATLLAMLQWRNQYLAGWARRALHGATTDRRTLMELLSGWPQAELGDMVRSYRRLHGQSLEAELRAGLSGEFRELALALVRLERDEDEPAGEKRARQLAVRLVRAGRYDDAFVSVLTRTSYPLLRQMVDVYPSVSGGVGLEQAIRAEFGGDLRVGLLMLIQCVSDAPGFFAERLYRAMKGLGTDDTTLIRVLVSRSEIDLENIKEAYQRRYGKSLAAAVEDDTSGYYWKCLKAIIK